jgi:hypothetical protein
LVRQRLTARLRTIRSRREAGVDVIAGVGLIGTGVWLIAGEGTALLVKSAHRLRTLFLGE